MRPQRDWADQMQEYSACLLRRVAAIALAFGVTACAQTPDGQPVTTASTGTNASTAAASLPPSVPGEDLESRLARLEFDLAQLKLDYSIVRPSFEDLVSRESNLNERLSALEGALGPVTASVPQVAAPPPNAPKVETQSRSQATTTTIGLHLASYRNTDRLKDGWAELKAAHPAELTGLEARIQRIDTGESGVFQRLLAGPVNSRTAASGLCRTLSAKGVYCKSVTFSGTPLN